MSWLMAVAAIRGNLPAISPNISLSTEQEERFVMHKDWKLVAEELIPRS